ncbi:hypothetical protein TNCV_4791321 [Trichonephila clavipes]|nr:hypothetical protein TNCV_4791321 [Trichonephila clavipes]
MDVSLGKAIGLSSEMDSRLERKAAHIFCSLLGMEMERLRSLFDEVETSEKEIEQAKEAPDEIMDINHDNESKFKKTDEHEKFESKERFCKCYLKNTVIKYMKPQVYHKTNSTLSKTQARKSPISYFSII